MLKGEVSLYCWPPVWLGWISLFCKWKQKLSVFIQLIPNSQTGVQWYSDTSPFSIPWLNRYCMAKESVKFHNWHYHSCQKCVCQTLYIKVILLIFLYLQMHFWFWVHLAAVQVHSWEGGWDIGISSQTIWSLLRTPLPAKPAGKIRHKVSSANSLKLKNTCNYTWSNAFDKVNNLLQMDSTKY